MHYASRKSDSTAGGLHSAPVKSISLMWGNIAVLPLPAALLEECKFQRSPLQHREGCDSDGPTGFAREAALQSHFLPLGVDLADIHRVEVPARGHRRVGCRVQCVYSAQDVSSSEVLARRLTWRRCFRPLICIHRRHLLNSSAEPLRAPPCKHHLHR